MIHVTIFKNSKENFDGVQVEGHAGFVGDGEFDIVCAACSMLTITFVNSIETLTEDEFSLISDEEDGLISFHFQDAISHDSELLMQSLILGFESMVANYSEYIDLTIEEV